jgi:hypothetical protein
MYVHKVLVRYLKFFHFFMRNIFLKNLLSKSLFSKTFNFFSRQKLLEGRRGRRGRVGATTVLGMACWGRVAVL